MSLDVAVWTACADDPTLFAEPLPPLGEALEACGLVRDDEWLAPPGFDFRRWRANARRVGIAERHDLDDDEALAVLAIVGLYERRCGVRSARGGGDAALAAFAAETVGTGSEGAAALGLFTETLEPLAPRAARPAVRWLRGKAHERLGDVALAEAAYEAVESLDPFPPGATT